MTHKSLATLAALILAQSAIAAELPSRSDHTHSNAPAKPPCEIGGEAGVRIADGACMRISGYVTVGVTAGNLKSH